VPSVPGCSQHLRKGTKGQKSPTTISSWIVLMDDYYPVCGSIGSEHNRECVITRRLILLKTCQFRRDDIPVFDTLPPRLR
jgi:hypothetical protein